MYDMSYYLFPPSLCFVDFHHHCHMPEICEVLASYYYCLSQFNDLTNEGMDFSVLALYADAMEKELVAAGAKAHSNAKLGLPFPLTADCKSQSQTHLWPQMCSDLTGFVLQNISTTAQVLVLDFGPATLLVAVFHLLISFNLTHSLHI
jgi:hypothetical protein